MKSITSRHNPLVRRLREAVREHAGEIVIEGPKQVADAIASGWKALAIASRGELDPLPPWLRAADAAGSVVSLSEEVFESVSETSQPQGLLGLFERPGATAAAILSRTETVAVALDGVQDPGNVGTIVRLAAAFDASGVLLLPGCADPLGPKAIRASVGAVLNVPFAEVTAQELVAAGIDLVAADAAGHSTEPPARSAVLVFGNEGSGLSAEIHRAARLAAVPMSARVESLNVASSAAILLARSYALRIG